MKNLICGMRFVGSNNVRLEGVNGPMASGILVDRLPPTRWDVSVDPEWIVKYDTACGGNTKCVRESILRRLNVSMAQ